jgi:hypothetical protein
MMNESVISNYYHRLCDAGWLTGCCDANVGIKGCVGATALLTAGVMSGRCLKSARDGLDRRLGQRVEGVVFLVFLVLRLRLVGGLGLEPGADVG